jgi:hypothetical protein
MYSSAALAFQGASTSDRRSLPIGGISFASSVAGRGLALRVLLLRWKGRV